LPYEMRHCRHFENLITRGATNARKPGRTWMQGETGHSLLLRMVIKVFQEVQARMPAHVLIYCGNIEKSPLDVSHLKTAASSRTKPFLSNCGRTTPCWLSPSRRSPSIPTSPARPGSRTRHPQHQTLSRYRRRGDGRRSGGVTHHGGAELFAISFPRWCNTNEEFRPLRLPTWRASSGRRTRPRLLYG
jgi:hypothetical protein